MVASVSNPVNWIRKKVNFEDRDTNADTVKTGTAWAAADDGMLVWDRNGNGSIDSGRELFGDETILANGQKAANGFAALAELDTGSLVGGVVVGAGDGKFDANDAQYANLRVWRDLNQDGISQAGELQTLAQTGVQSISLSSTASSTNYANGNATLVQSGSFTRTDGSAGQAGSFILAQDNFIRVFEPIALGTAAKAVAHGIATKSIAGCARRLGAKGRFDANNGMYRHRGPIGAPCKAKRRIGFRCEVLYGKSEY